MDGQRAEQPDRPLRVCLVSAAYHPYPSGVSEHVSQLAAALASEGLDVEVLTTRYAAPHDDAGEPVPVTRVGRARMVPLNGSYATFPLGLDVPWGVRRHLALRRPDVVHCHGVFFPEISYWAVRASEAINIVTFLSSGYRLTTHGSRAYRALFSGYLASIDGRVAISDRARRTYEAYVPGECRIIPSGVDVRRFRPGLEPPSGWPAPSPTVLFVGRLDRRKGLDVLLRAMRILRGTVPGARLAVVGDGAGRRGAERLARELGIGDAVDFRGRVSREELPAHFAACDVYCSPALGGESFGIVLLEAMASGVPIVASRIPGYDETVEDGRDGLLVEPASPRALASALATVLTGADLAARLAAAGRAKAERHDWAIIARRTRSYYEELVQRRQATSTPSSPA